jgi:hypothetical protein
MAAHVCHVDCVYLIRLILDFLRVKNDRAPWICCSYFIYCIVTVTVYINNLYVDKTVKCPQYIAGLSTDLSGPVDIHGNCEKSHKHGDTPIMD